MSGVHIQQRLSTMKRKAEDISVRISKDMSRILRHSPPPGAMDSAGWVSVPVLLQHLRHKPTVEQVKAVVESCEKKRFVWDSSVDPPRIRAAQGHTVLLEEPVLEPVTEASTVPIAVHVTSTSSWKAIQDSGNLLRMQRTHIHFATAPHHLRKNKWAELYLKLNLAGALAAGHTFFLSSNGVLLTEGPLPIAFVEQLERPPAEWREGAPATAAAAAAAAAIASLPAGDAKPSRNDD